MKRIVQALGTAGALLTLWLLVACGPTQPAPPTQMTLPVVTEAVAPPPTRDVPTAEPATDNTGGYPGAGSVGGAGGPGYPIDTGMGELSNTPPDPAVDVPVPSAGSGSVGGVLVREFSGEQFAPFQPQQLIMAEIINDSASGAPAFIRYNEQSPRAETFETGIFIFRDVPPGRYGFVVNLGFTEFPVTQDDGNYLLVDVAADQVIDLGQVFVALP